MANRRNARRRARRVGLIVSDFDGVFTDGMVYTDQNGIESVRCSRRDSLGINMLKRANILVHVISKEANPVVAARCKKMGITYNQAVEDSEGKLAILQRIAKEAKLDLSEVAYIGDDVNDLEPLKAVGFAATVADGHSQLHRVVHYKTKAAGGEHAVREFVEFILKAQSHPISY